MPGIKVYVIQFLLWIAGMASGQPNAVCWKCPVLSENLLGPYAAGASSTGKCIPSHYDAE